VAGPAAARTESAVGGTAPRRRSCHQGVTNLPVGQPGPAGRAEERQDDDDREPDEAAVSREQPTIHPKRNVLVPSGT
jgi:hypothetical protein